jgi:DNA (cytosine-5)-methyltransferase 1
MVNSSLLQLDLFNPNHLASLSCGVKFTFVDLFAGIGGFRIPLEELGGQCLGYSEIDKEAIKVYRQNFIGYLNKDEIELGDITQIDQLPNNTDLVVGGVPCQPWSVAGKLKGFDDPRGKLWFDVIRLLKNNQPKAFIFENVRGLASPKNRHSFEYLLHKFEEINYCVKWKIINSYDFGVPQSRERVFIVGIRNDLENCQEYQFPEPLKIKPKLLDIIDEIKHCELIEKVKLSPETLFGGQIPPSRNRFQKDDELNDFFTF